MLPTATGPSAVLLQLALTGILLILGAAILVRRAAARFFVASFAEGYEALPRGRPMPTRDGACAVCGGEGTKKCSRCRSARYCSQACQSKHWEAGHKLKCKKANSTDMVDTSSMIGSCRKRSSSGFSSISLVPARGSCKVLKEPKKILFPYDEFVKLFNWDKPGFPPCGLLNCGNSCFANVVLQCLACTRPLVAYLLERDHSKQCIRKQDGWCFLCELQVHVKRASESLHPFSPLNIFSRLPNIGGNLGDGRQEDAHEFMRFAIDTMQSICLDEFGGEKALDPSSQVTTLIQYIFGGHLRSQVICTKCNMVSNRFENMMDLTVEIQGDAGSLEECLDQFTVKEWLDGDNMYKCDGCNDYVKAWKRLTVHQAPNILTIALKRFQSGRFGKLNKRVTFPEVLDLTPYMSGNGDGNDLYTLYAVVVHVDMLNASFFGHYICYTKDSRGCWYRIDDCKVMNVEVEEVLSQGAYMLLYTRKNARQEHFIKPMDPATNPVPLSSNKATCISIPTSLTSDLSPQSNALLCETPANSSLLRDIEHEREFAIIDATKGTDPVGMALDVSKPNAADETEPGHRNLNECLETKSMPAVKGDKDIYETSPSLHSGKDIDLEKPDLSYSVLDDMVPVMPTCNKSIASTELSSIEVQATESPVHKVTSDTYNHVEEYSGTAYIMEKCTSGSTLSSPSITGSSQVQDPSVDLRPKLEHKKVTHSSSDLANGIIRSARTSFVSDVKESKIVAPSQVERDQRKSKPIFSRGFLDPPARKKSVVHDTRSRTKDEVKVNGYTTGQLNRGFARHGVHDSSLNRKNSPTSETSSGFICESVRNSSNEDEVFGEELDGMGHSHCNGSPKWSSCQISTKDDGQEFCLNGETSPPSNGEGPLLASNSVDSISAVDDDECVQELVGSDIKSNSNGTCDTALENNIIREAMVV